MIVKTCKVAVYVPEKRMDEMMDFLQKNAVMEIIGKERAGAEKMQIEERLKNARAAISVLSEFFPEKKGFFKRKRNVSRIEAEKMRYRAKAEIAEILDCKRKIGEIRHRLDENRKKTDIIREYAAFDTLILGEETVYTRSVIGKCKRISDTEIADKIQKSGARIFCEIAERRKDSMLIGLIYPKQDEAAAEYFMKDIDFFAAEYGENVLPKNEALHLWEEKNKLLKNEAELLEEMHTLSGMRRDIELYCDVILLEKERITARLKADKSEKIYILTGYIPKERAEHFKKAVEERGGAVSEEIPREDEVLPTAFKNNGFVSPVEGITKSYGMPSGGDIDPNPAMAAFYYWFFGMMFSDAGYGLLMMISCGILGFSKILEPTRRKNFKMFFACGVSTTLWGIAYGSFFGDLISTVSKTFGNGRARIEPFFLDPVEHALELLIISALFGAVHIVTALVLKCVRDIKNGDCRGAFFDGMSWIAVIVGAAIGSGGKVFGLNAVFIFGAALFCAGLIIAAWGGGRNRGSVIKSVMHGILSLYDITSFAGDILSYSRLMALGLATGVIATVVNVLASLGGNSIAGAVMFVVVAVFGHALNFAVNMLGAYVHTNRLQYVEFYRKFYEGGGKAFKPLSVDTEYFDFSQNDGADAAKGLL